MTQIHNLHESAMGQLSCKIFPFMLKGINVIYVRSPQWGVDYVTLPCQFHLTCKFPRPRHFQLVFTRLEVLVVMRPQTSELLGGKTTCELQFWVKMTKLHRPLVCFTWRSFATGTYTRDTHAMGIRVFKHFETFTLIVSKSWIPLHKNFQCCKFYW